MNTYLFLTFSGLLICISKKKWFLLHNICRQQDVVAKTLAEGMDAADAHPLHKTMNAFKLIAKKFDFYSKMVYLLWKRQILVINFCI